MIFIHIPKTAGSSVSHALYDGTGYGHMLVKNLMDKTAETFTVVRNPYDRAVSIFGHVSRPATITREAFIQFVASGQLAEVNFAYPMVDAITIDGKIAVSHVIRFENLQEEFNALTGRTLNWYNKSNRQRDYQQYYNDEAKKIVSELYAEDLQKFNYSFEGDVRG